MPYLDAKFKAIVCECSVHIKSVLCILTMCHIAKTGACGTKHEIGVQVNSSLGAELSLEAAQVNNPSDPFLNWEIGVCPSELDKSRFQLYFNSDI